MDRAPLKENGRTSRLMQPGSMLRKPSAIPSMSKPPGPVKRKSSPPPAEAKQQLGNPAKRPRISPNTSILSAPPTRPTYGVKSAAVTKPRTTQPAVKTTTVLTQKKTTIPAKQTRTAQASRPAPASKAPARPAPKPAPARPLRPEQLVRQLTATKLTLEQEKGELQNQVEGLKPELELYAADLTAKDIVIRGLEDVIAVRDASLESLQEDLGSRQTLITQQAAEIADLAVQIGDYQTEVLGQKDVISRQEAAISSLTSQVNDRDATISSNQQEISSLCGRVSALDQDLYERGVVVDRQRETINKRDGTITGLENSLEEARLAHEAMKARMAELQLTLEARRQDIAERDSSISLLETTKQGHLCDIKNLQDTVECREDSIAELESKVRDGEMTRRRLHNTIQELKGNIRVFCRVRPLLGPEIDATIGGEISHLNFPDDGKTLELARLSDVGVNESMLSQSGRGPKSNKYTFHFDSVFSPQASQAEVFNEISQVVQSALDGYSVCIFAYGQTGSGKTFTMEGPDHPTPDTWGMIPRAVNQVFESSSQLQDQGWRYDFEASFLEIYNETIRDLLGSSRDKDVKHEIKMVAANSSQVMVTNLNSVKVTSPAEVHRLLHKASENRAVAETKANERSSRSHSVFRLLITGCNDKTDEKCSGYLNLIDLAGSERLKESKSEGERLKETKNINSSLANLSNCIMALANKDNHVPFRNSKLTHLLSNSLGGTSKVLMFLNLSPREECFSESLNSLRFATKVNNCHIGTAQKKTVK